MQLYFREKSLDVLYLYYVVNDKQFEYIVNHQYRLFPVRLFNKPQFIPMLDKGYALRVAFERINWKKSEVPVNHVLRFLVRATSIKNYIHGSITNKHARIIIPHAELQNLNQAIVGYIERVESVPLI